MMTFEKTIKKQLVQAVLEYEAARDEFVDFSEQPNPGGDDFYTHNMRLDELFKKTQTASDKVVTYAVALVHELKREP